MTTHALMELADTLASEVTYLKELIPWTVGGVRERYQRHAELMDKAASQLRAAAAEGDSKPFKLMVEHRDFVTTYCEGDTPTSMFIATGAKVTPLYLNPPTDSGAGRDGWISVNDRAPKFSNWNKTSSGEVAVLNDRGEVMSAEWAFNTYASTERGRLPRWERAGRIYQGVVTHWQPLPPAIAGAAGE